jgi:hypothetical protein
MATLKRQEILDILSREAMSMDELVAAVQKAHQESSEVEIKSVVLPLLSSREVRLTSDRKLKKAAVAVAAGSQS